MDRVLTLLAENQWISGEEISRKMGITRAAVWKKICALRDEGWQIDAQGKKGYHLTKGDSLAPEMWQGSLETEYMGRAENTILRTVDSTNSFLKKMAVSGAAAGSLCAADEQTAGRGRLGRVWQSPPEAGLWLSVLLRPKLMPADAPLITLAAALAMAQAVGDVTGETVKIKWPNDIVADGRKLCGILLEISAEIDMVEYVIVGTGLNMKKSAYSEDLSDKAVSLEEICGRNFCRRDVLTSYLRHLEEKMAVLEETGFPGLRAEYEAVSATLGSRVQVTGNINITGTAEEIDSTGALIVRDDEGARHRVLSGDVSVRGIMGYV